MAESLQQLRAQARKAQAALWKAEAKERDRHNQAALGRCYKYHNSYGDEERWWLYMKIVGTEDGWMRGLKFEITSRGEIRVEPNCLVMTDHLCGGGYEPISEEEFSAGWREVVAALDEVGRLVSPA